MINKHQINDEHDIYERIKNHYKQPDPKPYRKEEKHNSDKYKSKHL